MSGEQQPRHRREITINSDWITMVVSAMGIVVTGGAVILEIRNFIFGHVGTTISMTTLMVALYAFLLAFSLGSKLMKVALVMIGTEIVSRFALHYLHASISMQHFTAIGGSIVGQIALTMMLIAMVQWFRSVIRSAPTSNSGDIDS